MNLDSLISLFSYDEKLVLSCKSFTHNTQLFATFDTIIQVQCDLGITRNPCGSISLLNYFNLFLKVKLFRLVFCFGSRNALHLEFLLCLSV